MWRYRVVATGDYRICWCGHNSAGSPTACDRDSRFDTDAGIVRVTGPDQGQLYARSLRSARKRDSRRKELCTAPARNKRACRSTVHFSLLFVPAFSASRLRGRYPPSGERITIGVPFNLTITGSGLHVDDRVPCDHVARPL